MRLPCLNYASSWYGHTKNTATNVDRLVDLFNTNTTSLLDKLAPFRPITIRERVHHPWFNDESKEIRRTVRLLERRFRTDNTPASSDTWKAALRAFRNASHVKAAEHWKTKITSARSNSRSVWRSLNTLLGERRTDSAPAFSALDYNDCIDRKTADIRASTASANPSTYYVCLSATLDKFDLVDVAEVVAAVRASPSKQRQLESLSTWLLKDCIALLSPTFIQSGRSTRSFITAFFCSPSARHSV